MPYRLSALAEAVTKYGLPCRVEGEARREVVGVATLEDAGPDEISFLANARYEKLLETTSAGAVIVATDQPIPAGMSVLRTADPYAAVTIIIVHIHGYRKHPGEGVSAQSVIDPSAVIGPGANIHHGVTIAAGVTIGRNVVIYPGCYIGDHCRLGDNCTLYPNVVIYEKTIIGHRVTVHAGSVIGEDGLGYADVKGKWHKIPQIGFVEIGDDVEIGANYSIDRATLGLTIIASGSKFSNLIAIGHGAKIGEDCMLVAQVGIAGSVTVGRHVVMAGKAGVAGHLKIGDNAQLGAMCGVMRDVPADTKVAGIPALTFKDAMRSFSLTERLPDMHKQIKQLEAQVAELQKALKQKR